MRMLADDEDELMTTSTQKQTSQQPAWMRSLFERCREWLGLLPTVGFSVCRGYVKLTHCRSHSTRLQSKLANIRILYTVFLPERVQLVVSFWTMSRRI